MTRRRPQVYKKNDALLAQPRIRPLWWADKRGHLIFTLKNPFSTNFDPNTRRKHLKNLIKPIHSHQKPNKSPQNLKSTRNKIFSQAQIFLGVFKVKKKP